ncbi:MAG: DUF1080 domain-containing protein [Bacteroidia bacterium]|nr:DUF1080 domain-containing protein [Bacteroidia bacterium]
MKNIAPFLIALGVLFACQPDGDSGSNDQQSLLSNSPMNELTAQEKADGWQLLFDGKTASGWHSYLRDSVAGWTVAEGLLSTVGGNGDLVSDETYENFELAVEWKVEPKGNSGIFFGVTEDTMYHSTYETGPEFQIIDDANYPDPLADNQKSGANYALHAPSELAARPAGEFNTTTIIVNQGKVEHWLNGKKVVSYELWTPEWEAMVAKTKFASMPGYGKDKKGHLALQDHGDGVTFRNIKIKLLTPGP